KMYDIFTSIPVSRGPQYFGDNTASRDASGSGTSLLLINKGSAESFSGWKVAVLAVGSRLHFSDLQYADPTRELLPIWNAIEAHLGKKKIYTRLDPNINQENQVCILRSLHY